MATNVRKYLWLSQLSLFGLLVICCLIEPSVVTTEGGVSSFGTYTPSAVPYILSFSLSAIFLFLAAHTLIRAHAGLQVQAYLLSLLGLLELSILVTTFLRPLGWTYSVIHDDLGVALYAYELVLTAWVVLRHRNYKTIALFLVGLLGSLVGLLSALNKINYLFVGQVAGAMSFGLLLAIAFPYIVRGDS